jgi:hypothetical protein
VILWRFHSVFRHGRVVTLTHRRSPKSTTID